MGPGAVLSHRDAATLHEIRYSNGTRVDVSTARERRGQDGIRIYRRRILAADDVTTVDAIPVTTVARTLLDLAEVLPKAQLSKALDEAERLGKLDVWALDETLERTRGRRGPAHANLRAALAEQAALGATLTRSELEDRFVALLDAHRIPRPRMNAWLGGMEVDALWPEQRLVVELDGYAFHHGRRVFHHDREKANTLVERGYRVLRFTHRHVTRDGARVAERLGRLLAGATPAPGSAAPLP
jgi:very-short-patch-repair endonuclease